MTPSTKPTPRIVAPLFTILLLAACGSMETTTPQPTATAPQHTPAASEAPPGADAFPLSKPGPHQIGILRGVAFQDADRAGREVALTIWYPAAASQDPAPAGPIPDAPPDRTGAPYPLILSSSKVGFIFAPHLASHGFVVVGVNGLDYYIPWDQNLIDQPLDILFALDQVASTPPQDLAGMIDADNAGAMGYSFDGYNALAMSGARIEPTFYLAQCAAAPSMDPPLGPFWIDYYCRMSSDWDQFSAHAGETITTSDDGLWQPLTDDRIRAVMPMAPEGAWLFGERGLAAVDRPILIIGATEDVECDYGREAVYVYEHIATPERAMISFVGQDHMMVYEPEMVARMAHLATAFFGYHLQGRDDLGWYFSQDFVARNPELAWGVYGGD
jgi:predicted dienelactone hydrolase